MKSLLALFVLFSLSAFAKEGGNGGDVVVCRDGNGEIKTIELLDYYEARQMRKFNTLEYSGLTDEQFFTQVGELFHAYEDLYLPFDIEESLELMGAIRHYIKTGESKVRDILFTNDVLTDITDSEELFLPRNCYVEQIAIWQTPSFQEDPRFILQADLLKRLSERDLRGLVLHEMIYKTLSAKSYGDPLKDSYSPRYLHEKLMSRPFKEFTFRDYFSFIRGMYQRQGAKNPYLRKGRFFLEINQALVQSDGRIEMNILQTDVWIVLNKEGKLDHKLTLEHGRIRTSPYYQGFISNFTDPGMLFLTFTEIPFVNPEVVQFISTRFGKNVMRVTLNPYTGNAPVMNWGITFKDIDHKKKYVTLPAAPAPMLQTFTKNFSIDLTEDFELEINDLP